MKEDNIYLDFDNRLKSSYLRNNGLKDENAKTMEELYFSIIDDVDIVLNLLKIPSSKKGFKYWQDAVFIYISANSSDISICNQIYPAIAKKYEKTDRSVERAMRLCFENTLYNVSKYGKCPISSFMYNYLINPKNSEILSRITELIVSKEFQEKKFKLKFMTN